MSDDNKIYFFDEMELLNFCVNPKIYGYGVLHQNLNTKSRNLNLLQAIWSPNLCFVKKVIYNGKMITEDQDPELSLPKISKILNPESHVHTGIISDVRNYLGKSCMEICNLSESLFDIRRMKAFFGVDAKDR